MKRMIGILMMVGLVVGVLSGCGGDNPVTSNKDLLVGTWLDEHGDWVNEGFEQLITFRSNGTFVDYDGDEGTWSLVGDQLTIAHNNEDIGYWFGSGTVTLNSVTDTEFIVTNENGERRVSTRQT